MLDVYWLEQCESDVPARDDWLNVDEARRLSALRVPKRRADWRLGRWTAKQAVGACADIAALESIEIRAAPDGAPEVLITNRPAEMSISISHRAGRAICAVCLFQAQLGCDLELIEPRNQSFLNDYFTDVEQALITGAPASRQPLLVTLHWSAKESALKVLRAGLRSDTRTVAVDFDESLQPASTAAWFPLRTRCQDLRIVHGWWQCDGKFVRTLSADPRPLHPIELRLRKAPAYWMMGA